MLPLATADGSTPSTRSVLLPLLCSLLMLSLILAGSGCGSGLLCCLLFALVLGSWFGLLCCLFTCLFAMLLWSSLLRGRI